MSLPYEYSILLTGETKPRFLVDNEYATTYLQEKLSKGSVAVVENLKTGEKIEIKFREFIIQDIQRMHEHSMGTLECATCGKKTHSKA